jgi:hypothetical protein
MHSMTYERFHRQTERIEHSIRQAFMVAGSLLISLLAVLILFFWVFLERSR